MFTCSHKDGGEDGPDCPVGSNVELATTAFNNFFCVVLLSKRNKSGAGLYNNSSWH